MIDVYLKFDTEAAANAVLYTVHPAVVGEDGAEVSPAYTTANYANIDVLGLIYPPMPPVAPGEEPGPMPDPLPGWHVNVRVVGDESVQSLLAYEVHPTQPRRVWA